MPPAAATIEPTASLTAVTEEAQPSSPDGGPTIDLPTDPAVTATATSRGPELEASEPESARLDAGQLQLVEFFRFT